MLLLQSFELVEDRLVGDDLLVDPSGFALGCLHPHEASAPFEDLQLVAVLYSGGAVRHGGNAVAQKCLLRRDIHILRGGLWSQAGAPGKPDYHAR